MSDYELIQQFLKACEPDSYGCVKSLDVQHLALKAAPAIKRLLEKPSGANWLTIGMAQSGNPSWVLDRFLYGPF